MARLLRRTVVVLAACALVNGLGASPASAYHGQERPAGRWACPPERVPPAPFLDVSANAHERQINCLPWYGVANGVTPNLYGPGLLVRRDQFASLLARTLTEARVVLPEGLGQFEDLEGNVHRDAVERLAAAGVVSGTTARAFEPAGTVSRAQVASFLARTYPLLTGHVQEEAQADYFRDDSGSVHENNINLAYQGGLVVGKMAPTPPQDHESGWLPGDYDPNALVRRDQAASFLTRALDVAATIGRGGAFNPYVRELEVLLKDAWKIRVTGSDENANAEVALFDPANPGPAAGQRLVIYRVRATYLGSGESTFDGP